MTAEYVVNDGGRAAAGFTGNAGDCVARSIAIVSGLPYADVYQALASIEASYGHAKSARNGVLTNRKAFKDYMSGLGFTWTATMGIGTGCKVHLDRQELPRGRLVVMVSKHATAVIDGVVHDTHDPRRYKTVYDQYDHYPKVPTRCVYGYWAYVRH